MKGNGENAQVELLMDRLQGRDNADAYAALKELLALSEATDEEVTSTMLLQAAPLLEHRARFPALLDADAFDLAR